MLTSQADGVALAYRNGRHAQVVRRSSVHHTQEVLELIVMEGIAEGVVVDEEFVVGGDESVSVLKQHLSVGSTTLYLSRCRELQAGKPTTSSRNMACHISKRESAPSKMASEFNHALHCCSLSFSSGCAKH